MAHKKGRKKNYFFFIKTIARTIKSTIMIATKAMIIHVSLLMPAVVPLVVGEGVGSVDPIGI